MCRHLITLLLLFNQFSVFSQNNFDILPDVEGIDGQATCFICIPDTTSIKIIGNRNDTIFESHSEDPWIGEFDYEGKKIQVNLLADTLYTNPFNAFNNALAHKSNNIYYYYARRHIYGDFFNPYLIEFNISTGEILRSVLITHSSDSMLSYSGSFMSYNKINNKILLLNSLVKGDSLLTYLVVLDTLFNINHEIEVKDLVKDNLPYWCKMNNDGSFIIIGEGLFKENQLPAFSDIYFEKIDSSGQVLALKLSPTSVNLNFGIANTRTIIEDRFGHWIIGGLHYENRSNFCQNCHQLIPYVFSTTAEFDTLLWQTRFYDLVSSNSDEYFLHSITGVKDGFIVAGDYLSSGSLHKSGVLFKVSFTGDSIWMKHYIPLNWEEDRVAWVNFNDIKNTPYGTIIVAGAIGDLVQQKVRPWILQLNSDGCLLPGCNVVSTNEEYVIGKNCDYFDIYPNPVSNELFLASRVTDNVKLNIKITSMNGSIVKESNLSPCAGYQYILPISDLISGSYYLIVSNPKTNQSENHLFIKQ